MEKTFRVGLIGLGGRGYWHLAYILCEREDVVVTYVCDTYEDRNAKAVKCCMDKKGWTVKSTTNYKELCESENVDVVVVVSAWENHIPACIYAMRCGKPVCTEVSGAYTVQDCWDLVNAQEETGMPCMMLENCCYGREELMVTKMVREGLFGTVAHVEGGYQHDLRDEISFGEENRHYRLRNYKNRCCDNYPTHDLGPIAKLLDINRGNRMMSLVSMASGAWGLNEFAKNNPKVNPELQTYPFAQGDFVKTLIKCAKGQTIELTLQTTTPRNYSRNFTVYGTKGYYAEKTKYVYLESMGESSGEYYNNVDQFREQWESSLWKKYEEEGIKGGHGGMDWLVFEAFFTSLKENQPMPIDVYDTAAWMVITPLSEISIANGSSSVDIPDFTRGMWTNRKEKNTTLFALDR